MKSELEEALEEVKENVCRDCDVCAEDMRNMEEGCEGFIDDVREVLAKNGQFGVGA